MLRKFLLGVSLSACSLWAFTEGNHTIEGEIKVYHIFDPAYVKNGKSIDLGINASAIGGHLRYISPSYANISVSVAGYYAQGTGLNDKNNPDILIGHGRFFDTDLKGKAILGEANLRYTTKEHQLKVGRQKIENPLTKAVSTYMPNMFEAAHYEYKVAKKHYISVGHIDSMAYGSRTPVEYGLIGEFTNTAGATQNALDSRGEFKNIGSQILADVNQSTSGLTFLGYKGDFDKITIQAWDFHAYDIINMFYLQADYRMKTASQLYMLQAQYLRVDPTGDNLAQGIGAAASYVAGLKFLIKNENYVTWLAYNHSGENATFNPWGGDPAFTSSFFSKNAYRSNVDAYKFSFVYLLNKETKIIANYAYYGQSDTLGRFTGTINTLPSNDAMEESLLLSYKPNKAWSILTGVVYKTSEYQHEGNEIAILDVDLIISYKF